VQFIEVTELTGVRSATITFSRPATALRFVIYPMVHLADARFYAQVSERLRQCDLVVVEGAGSRSVTASALSASYRWLEGSSRLALVVQRIDYRALGVPIVNPDITADEFDAGWRGLPLRQRLALFLVTPVYVLQMRLFGTRRFIAQYLAEEEEGHVDRVFEDQGWEEMDELIMDRRDRLLVEAIRSIHQDRHAEPIVVGVVYGAAHMRAVVNALWTLGYRPGDARWLTVFDL
jgi:hypothetical protein